MTNQNFFGHQTDSQRSLITPCYEHSTHVYVTTKTWQSLIHELDARQRLLKDELVDSFTANENARCEQLAFSCEQWQVFRHDVSELESKLSRLHWHQLRFAEQKIEHTPEKSSLSALLLSILDCHFAIQLEVEILHQDASITEPFAECISSVQRLLDNLKCLEHDHYEKYIQIAAPAILRQNHARNLIPNRTPEQFSERFANSVRTDPSHFREPIIAILKDQAGSCSFETILQMLSERMQNQLTDEDRLTVSFNPALRRWHLSVIFVRQILIRTGVISWKQAGDVWHLVE